MTTAAPLLSRKQQILGRVEAATGTAVSLLAIDAKALITVGAAAEYNAPREKRDVARASLTPIGNLESTKANKISFQVEANTPDTFQLLTGLNVESILWQSGYTTRVTFAGSPSLAAVSAGMYLTLNYSGNAVNDGTFLITAVSDGSDYVDIINRSKISATGDEAAASPAVGDIQYNLAVGWAFNASGMQVRGLSRIAIGTITSGPIARGTVINGAAGTGRVVKPAVTGDAHIYFVPLTGKLAAEALTCTPSGPTCTSSAGPEVYGHYIKPVSSYQEAATVELQQDGYAWSARSAMANMTIEAAANRAAFLNFEFQGPKQTNGTKAMTGSITRDNEDPPVLKNAQLTLGGSFTPVFKNFSLDMQNNVVLRENGNATDETGFETARITARDPKVTINLEHELAATFDFFGTLDAGTKTSLALHVGTAIGKQMWIFADELEFTACPIEDQDGLVGMALEAVCTGDMTDAEDELEIVII